MTGVGAGVDGLLGISGVQVWPYSNIQTVSGGVIIWFS